MKKLFTIIAIACLTLISCSGNGPEGVAKSFLSHTNKGEMAEAKKYCDEKTASILGMAESMLTPERIEEMKKKNVKIDIVSSEVKDETAKVTYQLTSEGEKSDEKTLDLKKVDGDWKVTMNKEGM
jgi:hypothetical protein